jgi:hypothetical protein
MTNRRLAIAGLALVAALGLTGCGPTDDQAKPDTGAPVAADQAKQADPAAALAAAAQQLSEQSLRFEMEMIGSITASGVADPKAGTAQMSMDMSALGEGNKIELRKVGDDLYMKFSGAAGQLLGAQSKKPWMHVDAAKLPAGSSFSMMSPDDPAGTKAMIAAMTKVERVGAHGFRGSLDLAKSPTYNKKGNLGALTGSTLVPFTATTDDQGRLVELTLDMSAMAPSAGPSAAPGGRKMKTTYGDFGTKVAVEAPPAAEVGELPPGLAGVLNA